jgi:hypothetical protein
MMELANTSLTVLRGLSVNSHGDLTDVGTPAYSGIPAALVESSKTVFDQATATPRIIRVSSAVVPDWADIVTSDTVMDERAGQYYMVISVTDQPSLGVPPDKLLSLRSRSGVTARSD